MPILTLRIHCLDYHHSFHQVSVSFWNLPGGNDNCARFDGTKGWLWSDTNCRLNLNFICQHSEWIKLMKVALVQ